MNLHLYDTQTREKRLFTPIDSHNVGMYVCGVTPYDHAHIGHARAYTVADVLFRLLRHTYGENHVKYTRNFTDIDDKIITRAAETGSNPQTLSEKFIQSFYEDMDALNILRPTAEPRVSDDKVLHGIMEHIDSLIEKGFAYVAPSGDVIYRTQKFPGFGALARRNLEEQQAGVRVAVDDEKESPHDFILWKANAKSTAKLEQAFEPAAYGARHFNAPGRPGWHIECSVMSKQNLGPMFDIHGGGEDLQFPHHCCEIAQSEALLPSGKHMANYWVHNGFITVNGTKMSKSLGNFTTIKDALQKYSPEAIRLWLLQTHYRKPVDYSDEALQAAENRIRRYKLQPVIDAGFSEEEANEVVKYSIASPDNNFDAPDFFGALADDLNTPKALAIIDQAIDSRIKIKMLNFLGIKIFPRHEEIGFLSPQAESLLAARQKARTEKNWPESDRLRDELKTQGIVVEDKPDGTTTWRKA